MMMTPCCKYIYSKNNVKILQLTSSEELQALLSCAGLYAASSYCFTLELFL